MSEPGRLTVVNVGFRSTNYWVVSLILGGTFELFPVLQLALVEGGFAWFPPCSMA